MKKQVYGYTRVSTVKQGMGVSLLEQKRSIESYALKHDLEIVQWFEEKETAAKYGRPIFSKMLVLLNKKVVDGVVIHKIDRSTRNLRDWADLGDLIDSGVAVHFSHEHIDFASRGGRLAADVKAVFSADYIRNLSDETKKGLYGRLNQGIYPFGAPIGYTDTGRGNLKEIDPVSGPLIKQAFDYYATGLYSFSELSVVMYKIGLRNTRGGTVSRKRLSEIFNNPFYTGVILIKKTGATFEGKHEPLISTLIFSQVQNIMKGKKHPALTKHDFLYRKCLKCGGCNRSLIAERQKGHVYYRCQIKSCPVKTVREEAINLAIKDFIDSVTFNDSQIQGIRKYISKITKHSVSSNEEELKGFKLQQCNFVKRLNRLAEKFADDYIDSDTYQSLRSKTLFQKQRLQEKVEEIEQRKSDNSAVTNQFLESLKALRNTYFKQDNHSKRFLLKILTSNLSYIGDNVVIEPNVPFDILTNMHNCATCCHVRPSRRTTNIVQGQITNPNQTVEYEVTKTKEHTFNVVRKNSNSKRKKKFMLEISSNLLHYPRQCHDVIEKLKQLDF